MEWRCWETVRCGCQPGKRGAGLDFIIGQQFMERHYVVSGGWTLEKHELIAHFWQVFDTDANRVTFTQR